MKNFLLFVFLVLSVSINSVAQKAGKNYENFQVAIYARAQDVREMSDLKRLDSIWTVITQQLKVDKIYLETHRDKMLVDEKILEVAKQFFISRGVQVAGGITYTLDEPDHFKTFCFSDPEQRKRAQEIAEYTANHFDEFILDDFFFINCKCDLCIKAKGDQSWTQYRLKLMTESGRDLVVNPAKAVNPKVKVVIKYPNWYEHFQGLGFNLEEEPAIFDGIYTGTETRDPIFTGQHLQQYESYLIYRFFENISPGKNGGGWVDPFASFYMDRYAEQLWNTLFAKAPEVTLFDYQMMQVPIDPKLRAPWQGNKTSFDFDEMMKPVKLDDGQTVNPSTLARACGVTFEQVDKFIGELGKPVGIKSYKPFHSIGEDYLHNYFGMIGLPIDLVPEFPADQKIIILSESAKFDKDLVEKIKTCLTSGNDVIITSGLLRELEGKGIEDIVELNYTDRKILVKDFVVGWLGRCTSKEEILFPQIEYLTNDSWEDITSVKGATGCPILHQAQYSKGSLYVLNIPENFSDLYLLPDLVLNRIREIASQDLNIRIEGSSQVSLFTYDNGSFIVESYMPDPVAVKVIISKPEAKLVDIITDETITGIPSKSNHIWGRDIFDVSVFEITIPPHSYRVLRNLN